MIKIGDVFGELVVIDENICKGRREKILVRCSCGVVTFIRGDSLKGGYSKSCGCKNGFQKKHGLTGTPYYLLWCRIRQRCFDKNYIDYHNYGGRGITVAEVFADPEVFIDYITKTLGPQPANTSLGRIDNNKGYAPGNLRWETTTEQNRNRQNTIRYEYEGKFLTVSEIAEVTNVDSSKLNNRVKLRRSRGYTFDIHHIVNKLKYEQRG